MQIFFLMLALLAPAAALAQPASAAAASGDPLHSPECRRALDALQVQEAAAAAAPVASGAGGAGGNERPPRTPDPRLAAARQHAAGVCLRSGDDPPPPRQPYVQTPITVLPPAAPRPAPTLPPLREPLPPLARPAERPRFITTCDAIGCWADDGSRLDRVGPNLRGPRGPCTLQGTLLTCP